MWLISSELSTLDNEGSAQLYQILYGKSFLRIRFDTFGRYYLTSLQNSERFLEHIFSFASGNLLNTSCKLFTYSTNGLPIIMTLGKVGFPVETAQRLLFFPTSLAHNVELPKPLPTVKAVFSLSLSASYFQDQA